MCFQMYPSYKYKPKKRTVSVTSEPQLPISPPTSVSSGDTASSPTEDSEHLHEDDLTAAEEADAAEDSLGSLEDLDLLDVGDIEDNGLQDIIEEVMTMEDGAENSENVQPSTNTGHRTQPRVLIPKLTQAVLAPKKKTFQDVFQSENPPQAQVTIPLQQKSKPGPGRPRKNKANVLKPVTTVYKKTTGSAHNNSPEFQTETASNNVDIDSLNLPPIKRIKLSEAEIINILQDDASNIPSMKKSHSATKKVEEIEKELLEVDKLFCLEEENPPSVDNPRLFKDLEAQESTFIGDIERTFAVFDELSGHDSLEDKHIEFMKKLDNWGSKGKEVRHHLDGFYSGDNLIGNTDMEDLAIPEYWHDEELFEDLDSRLVTESIFLNTWLPKFALKVRRDPYRALLRSINKKDPEFNIIW